MNEGKQNQEVLLEVKLEHLDELIDKAKRYVGLLQEAKSLAEELASCNFKVEII